jgi:hypothetical protein
MATQITRDVLESYLNCKTKAYLRLAGQQGSVSDYENLLVCGIRSGSAQLVRSGVSHLTGCGANRLREH